MSELLSDDDSPGMYPIAVADTVTTAEPGLAFFNYGPGLGTVASMLLRPQPGGTASRAKRKHKFADRPRRVLYAGNARELAVSTAGRLVEDTSALADWETAAEESGVGMYRDPKGRRVYCSLEGFAHQWVSPSICDVAFTVEDVEGE